MAQATVDLGLNTAAFTAGLNEAERKSQSFEGRVAGLFKRSPLLRAERAFSEFAVNLSTGNVAQGVAGFAAKLSGLGLAAGVGIGVAIGFFQKFKGQLDATAKAAAAVNIELAKPLSLQLELGSDIKGQIATLDTALANLAEKRKSFASRIQEAGVRGAPEAFDEIAFARGQAQPRAIRTTQEEQSQLRGFERRHALRRGDVEFEKQITDIHALATQFSEKEAALEKNRLDAEQKRAALRLKFGDDPREAANLHAELLNISRDEKLSADEIRRKATLKEKELAIEKNIAEQALRGISADDQKISRLKQELDLIQEQLRSSQKITEEHRKQLETQEAKTKAALQQARQEKAQADLQEQLSGLDKNTARTQSALQKLTSGADNLLSREMERARGFPGFAELDAQFDPKLKQLADEAFGRMRQANLMGQIQAFTPDAPMLKLGQNPRDTIKELLSQTDDGTDKIVSQLEELSGKMDTYWGS